MSKKQVTQVLLSQIEDVLEEREGKDRRQRHQGVPEHVSEDRRKLDRRAAKAQQSAG